MAKNLSRTFGGFLLPNMYGRSFDGDNLGKLPTFEELENPKLIKRYKEIYLDLVMKYELYCFDH